jgi:hypothetical protein
MEGVEVRAVWRRVGGDKGREKGRKTHHPRYSTSCCPRGSNNLPFLTMP